MAYTDMPWQCQLVQVGAARRWAACGVAARALLRASSGPLLAPAWPSLPRRAAPCQAVRRHAGGEQGGLRTATTAGTMVVRTPGPAGKTAAWRRARASGVRGEWHDELLKRKTKSTCARREGEGERRSCGKQCRTRQRNGFLGKGRIDDDERGPRAQPSNVLQRRRREKTQQAAATRCTGGVCNARAAASSARAPENQSKTGFQTFFSPAQRQRSR